MLRLCTILSCTSMSLTLALTGCSGANFRLADQTIPTLHGRLMGGQQPISGAIIQLYTVGTSADGSASTPMITTTTVTTGSDGTFNITADYSCTTSNATDVYITSTGGDPTPGAPNVNLTLMAALGQCSTLSSVSYININELTTVAAVAALHPYMASITAIGSGSGDATSLDAAFTVASELVNNATGLSPGTNVPSGHTVPSTLINSLGDVIVRCVNSASGPNNAPSSSCATLFSLATPPGGTAPKETVGALLNIENYPTQNASALWDQIGGVGTQFLPDLSSAPSTWAIALIPESLSLAAASSTLIAKQDGTPIADSLTLTRSAGAMASVMLTASGLPTGLSASFTQFGFGNTGSVTFTTSNSPTAAGTYTVTLSATDGTVTATTTVVVTVAVVLTVTAATDTSSGFSGHLQQFMSTNVLPNSGGYFENAVNPLPDLEALDSVHIRIQPNADAIPWMTNTGASGDWVFTDLEATTQPMLTFGDMSPTFQIAEAPPFMYTNGYFDMTQLPLFITYAQNLVRYYNTKAGFNYGGKNFVSPSGHHITWWEIWNEPNITGLASTATVAAADYVKVYNAVVPEMLQIDPTLKFIAVSLSDSTGAPQAFLPTLVEPATMGGLNAQVDAVATHFYGTCNHLTTDADLFAGIAGFVSDINYFHSEFAKRSDLAHVPVWVNEHNVNSECPKYPYFDDTRGTSVFFTAYRPLTFARFGKAASKSLYHYSYEGKDCCGEVLSTNTKGPKFISYWTDYWLQRTFPWDGVSTGSTIYVTTTTETTSTVEILAVQNADNSVSIMVTNYAVANSADDNGAGAARLVYVDLSALGTFSSATQVDLNASTSTTAGPTNNPITPPSNGILTLTMSGYGSSMFVLKP